MGLIKYFWEEPRNSPLKKGSEDSVSGLKGGLTFQLFLNEMLSAIFNILHAYPQPG